MNMKKFLSLLIITTIFGLMAGAFHVILDELKKQRETSIEADGYTYKIEESKPPETIKVDGKTYVLVTE